MKKIIISLLTMVLTTGLFTGCSERAQIGPKEVNDLTTDGNVNYQTSIYGIDSSKKNFEELLYDNWFYVVHDGIYYPLTHYITNYELDDGYGNTVQRYRQQYFTTENEINIPTLFPGDELVYYSKNMLLDTLEWARFYDLGYTIGVYSLNEMQNGRIYLDLSDDEKIPVIPDSELFSLVELKEDYILLDKIGGHQIDNTFLGDGLINVVQKSKKYDLEVYVGTNFKHLTTTANIHAFREYELFGSIEYETLQDRFYKIEVPEYLPTGYYCINGYEMFRLVREESFSDSTDFNEQLLFPALEDNDTEIEIYNGEEYIPPRKYSTFELLNYFTTDIPGKFGYVEPKTEEEMLAEEQEQEKENIILKEATIKEFELFFFDKEKCSIIITSTTGETTGDMYVEFDGYVKPLTFNRLEGNYSIEFTGNGKPGTLVVSGLIQNYNIKLINCEQYDEQKHGISAPTSDNTESNTEENTETSEERTQRR